MNVAEKQIQAFNEKNLEKFLACYNEDCQSFMLSDNQVLSEGKQQLGEIMKESFEKSSNVKTEIIETMIQGNLIIQKEKITGHGENVISTVSIYEIVEEKISKLWFGGRLVH